VLSCRRQYLRRRQPAGGHLLRQAFNGRENPALTVYSYGYLRLSTCGCTSGSVKDTDFGRWLARLSTEGAAAAWHS
jgi:hypothetical protein